MIQKIRRKKVIWATILVLFLVLVLSKSYYLYTHRSFSYFEHSPTYYDKLSYIKLLVYSIFQIISSITCGLLAINVCLDKIDIEYERLFYITCFSLCIVTIILEYFKFWERCYDTLIQGYIIVGAMTIGIISLLSNILVNFVKDKISNKYAQLEET